MRTLVHRSATWLSVAAASLASVILGLHHSPLPAVTATPAGDVSVAARGLRIVGAAHGGHQGLRPFNHFTGTTVVLIAHRQAGGLIRVDESASAITSFTDNRGKDLLVKGEFAQPGLSAFATVSDDGTAAMVEVFGGALPTPGAQRLSLTGSLVLRVATEQRTYRHDGASLTDGTVLRTGPIAWTVEKTGKPDWGNEPFAVTFSLQQELDRVAAVRFIDPDGTPIEHKDGGTMTARLGGALKISKTYRLTKRVSTVSLEIDAWTDMKAITVPVATTLTLGL